MNQDLYEVVRALIAIRDEREISDEARAWARDEFMMPAFFDGVLMTPGIRGAWLATLELAFDAGRMMGQREGRPPT